MSGKMVGKRRGGRVARNTTREEPTWSGVKANLANVDRAGLVGLIKDLHGFPRQPSVPQRAARPRPRTAVAL